LPGFSRIIVVLFAHHRRIIAGRLMRDRSRKG
jgi:hypothetical protein